ncbi:MAG: hypothetical protein ACE5KV_01880 [Thermoplasmata archaeon]
MVSDFLGFLDDVKLEADPMIDEWLEGYKFLIVACLHRFGWDVILCNEFLCVEEDRTVTDLWNKVLPPLDEYPSDSEQGMLLNYIWELRTQVLKARSWIELESRSRDLMNLVGMVLDWLGKRYEVRNPETGAYESLATKKSFRILGPLFCSVILGHSESLEETYSYMYQPSGHLTFRRILEEESSLENWLQRAPSEDMITPAFFVGGIAIGLWYIWRQLLPNNRTEIDRIFRRWIRAENWSESHHCYGALRNLAREGIKVSEEANLRELGSDKIQWQRVVAGTFNEKKDLEFVRVFKGHPIRIVQHTHPGQAIEFIKPLLIGLAAVRNASHDKVPILRLRAQLNDFNRISYAVLMEAYGPLETACEWWVFFAIATDRRADLAYCEIEEMLKSHSDALDVSDVEFDERSFLNLCEPSYLRKASRIIDEVQDFVEQGRGVYLEILVAYWLHTKGWERVRVGETYRSLDGQDLDVVAFREKRGRGELLIVECKGPLLAIPVVEIGGNLEKLELNPNLADLAVFKKKVDLIAKNPRRLLQEAFDVAPDTSSLSGLTVRGLVISRTPTTQRIEHIIPSGLEHMSWDVFLKALRKSRIPRRLYDPLTREVIKEYRRRFRTVEHDEFP